tara:strand:+ start:195 stop:734 length:540 start_codon:yes stop_codon:yes gene_type:complete
MRVLKSITLVELVVSILLVGFVLLGVGSVSVFLARQVANSIERYNIYSQLTYAIDDVRARCISAIDIKSGFDFTGEIKSDLEFNSEEDIYIITPDDDSDNTWYRYYINNSGSLVLEDKSTGEIDILVEERFSPEIEFEYTSGEAPNFITMGIIAKSSKNESIVVSRKEGIRFWFIEVVQ